MKYDEVAAAPPFFLTAHVAAGARVKISRRRGAGRAAARTPRPGACRARGHVNTAAHPPASPAGLWPAESAQRLSLSKFCVSRIGRDIFFWRFHLSVIHAKFAIATPSFARRDVTVVTVVHRSLAWTVRQRQMLSANPRVCSQCALSRACRFRYNALVNTPNVLRGEARNARRWPTISCELIRSSYPHAQCTSQHPLTRDAILRGTHIEAGTEMATASASLVAVLAPAAPNSSLSLASLLA